VKALAISLVVGASLCGIMSAPASTMPMSNLAVAASDLALGQSVRYRHQHRYRLYNYYSGPSKGLKALKLIKEEASIIMDSISGLRA
jgi:hypothetical protein